MPIDLIAIADDLHGIPDSETKISVPCPVHGELAATISLIAPEKLQAACPQCETKALWRGLVKQSATLARLWAEKSKQKEEKAKAPASGPAAAKRMEVPQPLRPETQGPKLASGPLTPLEATALEPVFTRVPPHDILAEQSLLGAILRQPEALDRAMQILTPSDFDQSSHREIYKAMLELASRGRLSQSPEHPIDLTSLQNELKRRGLLEQTGGVDYLLVLDNATPTALHVEHWATVIHEYAIKRDIIQAAYALMQRAYNGSSLVELAEYGRHVVPVLKAEEETAIVMETQDQSLVVNEEYLARPEIIEGLGYSQSIMLFIGGKHSGKTTNLRTMALSVARGLDIWGRKTVGAPVIYAASDDEIVSTRNELLQMGWQSDDRLYLARIAPDSDGERLLEDLAEQAIKLRTVMIIVDMLFDFVGIKDEMSYAGTREAINRLQHLADRTGCLVVASHHTPKYLNDAHNAANAALGSQGISARFSPIILVRKWTETLFTIESTATRDPRGKALVPQKIVRTENGRIETDGEFKEWMKWQMYADRVMGLFEGGDPKVGYSVHTVAERLEIARPHAQNALYQLTQAGKLTREKIGRSYKYFLKSTSMFDREGGEFSDQ